MVDALLLHWLPNAHLPLGHEALDIVPELIVIPPATAVLLPVDIGDRVNKEVEVHVSTIQVEGKHSLKAIGVIGCNLIAIGHSFIKGQILITGKGNHDMTALSTICLVP